MPDSPRPPLPARALRRALRILWTGVVLLSVGVVVLVAAVWLMLPKLDQYRPDLERGLSGLLGESVTIGAVETYWEGWKPVLRFEDVRLHGPAAGPPIVRLEQARITVDPVASLEAQALRAHSVTIVGASLLLLSEPEGGVALAGPPRKPADAPVRLDRAFTTALLSQRILVLRSATVRWRAPGPAASTHVFEEINLRLENTGSGFHLEGSLRAPGAGKPGNPVVYIVDVAGDVTGPGWSAQAYLNADGLDLAAVPVAGRLAGIERLGGSVSVDVRTRLTAAGVESLDGTVDARNARVAWDGGEVRLAAASSDVEVRRRDDGWAVALTRLVADPGHGPAPETRGRLGWRRPTADAPARLSLAVDRAAFGQVAPLATALLPPGGTARDILARMQPDAELRAIEAAVELSSGSVTGFRVALDVEDLDTQPAGAVPGVEGVRARVEITRDGGRVALRPGPVEVRNDTLFAAPFVLEPRSGTVAWRRVGEGLRIEANGLALGAGEVTLNLDGALDLPAGGAPPGLDLRLRAANGDVRNVIAILPRPYVGPKVAAWMERAIEGGHLHEAELSVHGPVGAFPYDDGSGKLEARARVSGMTLRYGRRWPTAEDVSGELAVEGRVLRARLDGGSVFDTRLRSVEVRFDDVFARPAVLKLSGRFEGPVGDAFRYLEASPLADRYRASIEQVAVDGASEISLDVELPLGRKATRVEGTVTLRNNVIVGRRFEVRIEDASGVARFDRAGLSARGIEGRYLGAPVRLDVAVTREEPTRVHLVGEADPEFVARQLRRLGLLAPGPDGAPLPRVAGRTRWQADVLLPSGESAGGARSLAVRSGLEGLALDLPAPFGKAGDAARPLAIRADLSDPDRRSVSLRYGDDVSARLRLNRVADRWALDGGRVALGGPEAASPDGPGLVVTGRLDPVPVDGWLDLALGREAAGAAAKDGTGTPARGSPDPSWIDTVRTIDLATGGVEAMGRRLAAERLTATRGAGDGWTIAVTGEDLAGEVVVPAIPGEPVSVAFAHLRLRSDEPRSRTTDPRLLPPIAVRIDRLVFDERPVGRTAFRVVPEVDGVRFEDLSIEAPHGRVAGGGSWRIRDRVHATRLAFTLETGDLGDLLAAFGHEEGAVEGGDTTLSADVGWIGRPGEFGLGKLGGSLQVRAADGRLLGLRPGLTGRAFGLLSLQALRQRLRLDFQDIFGRGLHFDRINGSFTLADGDAYTNDLTLDGPSVRIEVAGRVGLAAEDYDQTVTVTPKLSTSLPLVPIWLAEKVMGRRVFDKSFASQYTITGTWSDPQVERVRIDDEDDFAGEDGGP